MEKEKIVEIINKFNKEFGTKCKLINIKNDEIIVLFSGHECYTCGAFDYFEDLATYFTENLKVEYGVAKYEQSNEKYIVHYLPKNKIKKVYRDVKMVFYK